MDNKTPEITRLIHESLWTVISYAFGRPAIEKTISEEFSGGWKFLNKTVYELSERKADRALIEMATQLRTLDNAEGLNDFFSQTEQAPLGYVLQGDGTRTDLHFRDLTNKVMHANGFEWRLSAQPKIICRSDDPKRWQYAEIDVIRLMGVIGGLMH